jgi:hypothetical protein
VPPRRAKLFSRCLIDLPPGASYEYDPARRVCTVRDSGATGSPIAYVSRHPVVEFEPAETLNGMLQHFLYERVAADMHGLRDTISVERVDDSPFECQQGVMQLEDGIWWASRMAWADDDHAEVLIASVTGPREWILGHGLPMLLSFELL